MQVDRRRRRLAALDKVFARRQSDRRWTDRGEFSLEQRLKWNCLECSPAASVEVEWSERKEVASGELNERMSNLHCTPTSSLPFS